MALLHDDHDRSKYFSRRAMLLAGGKTLLLGALVARMYDLQVLNSDRYRTLAEDNRISMRLLPPPRGRIFDRFGTPIAVNEQNYRVVLVAEQAEDVEHTLDRLGRIIEISKAERARILSEVRKKRGFVPVTVRENLPWESVSRIEVNAPDLAGISIDVGQTRHYPYGPDMAHVLGYVGAVAEHELTGEPLLEIPGFRIGKSGLEKRYDTELRGSAGASQVEVNAVGRTIRELNRQEGQPGDDLVVTLDAELQKFVQRRLSTERSASAVLMDMHNGDVLALASTPSFDPNVFSLGLSRRDWQSMVSDPLHPLTNKATAGLYSPGSTFKMVVALAVLEHGIRPEEEVFCPGHYRMGDSRFHCWRRWGHGEVDMVDAIKKSCDVYFYEMSRRVGIDRIAEVARRFSLGSKVGIDLPGERDGTMPTREWKSATLGERWHGGETLVAAIGQGYVLATPLQLAVMTARLVTGLAVTPRLTRPGVVLEGGPAFLQPPEFPEINVPQRHLAIMHTAMDAVVNEQGGTAYAQRIREAGWEMGGKTGTSQVRRITLAERREGILSNEERPWRHRHHALFVGYAPVRAPRYCFSVIVEHGGGGASVAAPIARDVLIETQRRDPAGQEGLPRIAGIGAGGEG